MLVLAALLACRLAFTQGEYEVVMHLTEMDPPVGSEVECLYMRAVAAHQLRNKNETVAAASAALDWFGHGERRHIVMCQLLLDDCLAWKDDLGGTGRKMREVVNRLESARSGPVTQAKQKAILDELDDRIRELENIEEEKKPLANQAQAKSSRPAPQSVMPQDGPSTGKVEGPNALPTAAEWGKLPEADRIKVVQNFTQQCPPRYRADYEAYVKELQKR